MPAMRGRRGQAGEWVVSLTHGGGAVKALDLRHVAFGAVLATVPSLATRTSETGREDVSCIRFTRSRSRRPSSSVRSRTMRSTSRSLSTALMLP